MFLNRLRNYYAHDLPLRYKFLIVNVLILLAMSVSASLIFYRAYRIVTEDTIVAESALVTQTGNAISERIRNLGSMMNTVSSLSFLTRTAYAEDPDTLIADDRTGTLAQDFLHTLDSLLDSDLVTALRIYINPAYSDFFERLNDKAGLSAASQPPAAGSEAALSTAAFIRPLSDVRSSYWHGIFMGLPAVQTLLCPDFYLTNLEKQACGELAYISRFGPGIVPGSPDPAAYIAIYFSRPELEAILRLNQHDTETGSVYYLVNGRGNLVASSNATLSGLYFLDYEKIAKRIASPEEFYRTTILGTELYMAYRDIENSDWRLVSVIPVKNVTSAEQALFRAMILIFIVLSAVFLLLEFYLTNSITSRVSRITRQMLHRDRNTPDRIRIGPEKDEVGQLVTAYNSAMDQLSELMAARKESAEKLKLSEVRALQAQINPHFLYNMLDMINWLSISGNTEAASEAIQSLSNFYKLTLSRKQITVPLKEELRHVELYVSLQNMRFDHGISLLVDVPDELQECEIPKLILQPIVENAILHGIWETESRKGSIVIMAWCDQGAHGEDIVIIVSDDGVGIRPEVLEGILGDADSKEQAALSSGTTGAASRSSSGSNIAIYNTHQRLRLIYGLGYGLKFSSTPGEGTEVEIRIPRREFRPDEDSSR